TQEPLPLVIGNEWTFRVEVRSGSQRTNSSELKISVMATERIGDVDTYVLAYSQSGSIFQKGNYAWKEGRLYLHRTVTDTQPNVVDPPKPVLESPLGVGRKWAWSGFAGTYRGAEEVEVVSMEKTVVPAGTFDAYKVKYVLKAASMGPTVYRWFVDGVGLVKEEHILPNQASVIVLELTSSRLASPQGVPLVFIVGLVAVSFAVAAIVILTTKRRRVVQKKATLDNGVAEAERKTPI
ncbi:MAG: hypothetical protein V1857_06400, partial [archaeon]